MDANTAVAAVRFGLGRRPGDPEPHDPLGWLDGQIGPVGPMLGGSEPVSLQAALALYHQVTIADQADLSARRELTRQSGADGIAWTAHCLASEAPFQDRLTNFWMNHLTISRRVNNASIFIGPQLRDVVRANLFGRFADLVIGTVRNPGMLIYLSNAQSMGPNSRAGRRTRRGLNENLAREVLELHTVSAASGYTQSDVTEFAKLLTGWGVDRQPDGPGFLFREGQHEPGPKTVLGQRFEEGEAGGLAALGFLASHPATYRHLATKLARHFVGDDPPQAAVDRLYGVLRDTGGDLGATARALVRLPQAWAPPLSKVRNPQDYVLAVGRALDLPAGAAERLTQSMARLGQPLWNAPQPVGWTDADEEWAMPEALLHRIEWAHAMAGRGSRLNARDLAAAVLGPLAGAATLREAARAGSPQDALTLLLVSPEFQRR